MITVRLDATEKLVIHCTEHVRDFQLVDPAVTQPLAVSQQRVETCVCAEHVPDHAGAAYSMRETTTAWDTSCIKFAVLSCCDDIITYGSCVVPTESAHACPKPGYYTQFHTICARLRSCCDEMRRVSSSASRRGVVIENLQLGIMLYLRNSTCRAYKTAPNLLQYMSMKS